MLGYAKPTPNLVLRSHWGSRLLAGMKIKGVLPYLVAMAQQNNPKLQIST
ncbi:MAG: hypothetical protein ACFCUV_08655 [Rivularia sp. (in: cyanobacteria)]